MKKWTGLLLMLALLLPGCTQPSQEHEAPRVVVGIEASYDSDKLTLRRQYSDSDKLRGVLTYLRCLDIRGNADPEAVIPQADRGRIVIRFSDGSTKTYEQQAQGYLRLNNGPWQHIDPEQAREFPLLLGLMESDKIS